MTTKTLIITPQGTAREINKIHKPIRSEMGGLAYLNKLAKWQKIEDSLKEYKIIYSGIIPVGTIHKCEVNEVDKTAIIL